MYATIFQVLPGTVEKEHYRTTKKQKRNVETEDKGIKTEFDQLGSLRWEYAWLWRHTGEYVILRVDSKDVYSWRNASYKFIAHKLPIKTQYLN